MERSNYRDELQRKNGRLFLITFFGQRIPIDMSINKIIFLFFNAIN